MTTAARPPHKRLGELLLEAGVITPVQLEAALKLQRQFGVRLGRVLIDKRVISEEGLVSFLAQQLGIDIAIAPEAAPAVLTLISLQDAERMRVFPLGTRREPKGETLLLAMEDPTNADTVDAVQFKTGMRVTPLIIGDTALESAIRRHYHGERPRESFEEGAVQFAGTEIDLSSPADSGPGEDDIPVITGSFTTSASATDAVTRAVAPPAALPPQPSALMSNLFGPAGAYIGSAGDPNDDAAPVMLERGTEEVVGDGDRNPFASGPFAGLAPPRAPAPNLAPVSAHAIGLELAPVPAEEIGLELAPVPAEEIGLELAPVPAEEIGLELAPVSAEEIGLELVAADAEEIGLELAPGPAEAIGLELVAADAEEIGLELAPVPEMVADTPSSVEAPSSPVPSFDAPARDAPSFAAPSFDAPSFDAPFHAPARDPLSFNAPDAPPLRAPSRDAPSFQAPASAAPPLHAPAAETPGTGVGESAAAVFAPVFSAPFAAVAALEAPAFAAPPWADAAIGAGPPVAMAAAPVADEPTNVASTDSSSIAPIDDPRIALNMAKPDLATVPYCPDCGATRLSGAKFCPHCGCSFTGVNRAKGALPAVAPATRPMMPASAAPRIAPAHLSATGALDIEALEGVKPFLTGNVVNFRQRTAPGADVDEPDALVQSAGGKNASVGLGVTMLVPSLISDASGPDEPDAMGQATMTAVGQGAATHPMPSLARARLHLVTQGMARVDDANSLGPAPTSPSTTSSLPPPEAARAARAPRTPAVASANAGVDIQAIESQWAARLTSQGGLVDDATALASGGKSAFALGLGVTHQAAVFADAALVDDPAVLAGGKAAPSHITRAVINGASTGFGRGDDVDVIAPGAPPQWLRAREPALHNAWADAAEKMIPRKDDRSNVAAIPSAREAFFAPDTAAIPPPPAPEPVVAYVPAPPVAVTPAAPWAAFGAAFAAPTPGAPAAPAAPAPAAEPKKPGSATMMMSLDAVELRALAERLVQKGALSNDDVDAAKKK